MLRTHNKLRVDFSGTSMSDLVFLLLIFFVITSAYVSPNVINLLLPRSDTGKQSPARNIEVYINAEKEYFVNPAATNSLPVPYEDLLPALQQAVANDKTTQKAIVLRSDKSVPIENVVILMDVLNDLNESLGEGNGYKIVLATEAQ